MSSQHPERPRAAPAARARHERVRDVREWSNWGRVEATLRGCRGCRGMLLIDDRRRAPRTALPDRLVGPRRTSGAGRAGCRILGSAPRGVRARQRHECSVERGRAGPAGGARAVGAAIHAARGRLRRTSVVAASLPSACSAGRPSGSPAPTSFTGLAARARRRHLLRARPAEGLGGLPRAPSQPSRRSSRREPLWRALSVTCLTANRWRVGLSFLRELSSRAAPLRPRQRSGDVVAHMDNMRWMLGLADALRSGESSSGRRCLPLRRMLSPRLRTASSATRSHFWSAPQRAPAARSASSPRSGARSLTEVEIEDELRAIVADVAEIDAGPST